MYTVAKHQCAFKYHLEILDINKILKQCFVHFLEELVLACTLKYRRQKKFSQSALQKEINTERKKIIFFH